MRPDKVNYAYFACSLAVWFVMPMLVIPVALTLGYGHETDCHNFMRHKWYLRPLYYTQQLIMGYAISILAVYVYVPIGDIYFGFLNLFCHSKFKLGSKSFNHADWPAYKLFEQVGEAFPQFLIAITFYANNAHWLPRNDLYFGIFTMTMSAGSIVMGIATGIRTEVNSGVFTNLFKKTEREEARKNWQNWERKHLGQV